MENQVNKTKIILAAIIVAGILIGIYMLMGDSRPEIDIPTPDGNIHIERNSNEQ